MTCMKSIIVLTCLTAFSVAVFCDDAAVIKKQQNMANTINEKLGTHLKTGETKHFIVHYDIQANKFTKQLPKVLEGLYAKFKKTFRMNSTDKLWDGKLLVYFWNNRANFVKFAQYFDNFNASAAGGYFAFRGNEVHINMPYQSNQSNPNARDAWMYEVLCHEVTHAFLQFYKTKVRIRPWLNEGLANFMAFHITQTSAPHLARHINTKRHFISLITMRLRTNSLRSLTQLSQQYTMAPSDHEGYAIAWVVVAFMAKYKPREMVKFIQLLKKDPHIENVLAMAAQKKGKDQKDLMAAYMKSVTYQNECFEKSFGVSLQDFEKKWLAWLKANITKLNKIF